RLGGARRPQRARLCVRGARRLGSRGTRGGAVRRNAEAIEEGVAIALAAARLQLKNRILVDTIVAGEDFALEAFATDAREVLVALADEQDDAASAMTTARVKAWGRHSDPHGTHDYRDRDVRNLRRRAKQYVGVAKRLRALAESDDDV